MTTMVRKGTRMAEGETPTAAEAEESHELAVAPIGRLVGKYSRITMQGMIAQIIMVILEGLIMGNGLGAEGLACVGIIMSVEYINLAFGSLFSTAVPTVVGNAFGQLRVARVGGFVLGDFRSSAPLLAGRRFAALAGGVLLDRMAANGGRPRRLGALRHCGCVGLVCRHGRSGAVGRGEFRAKASRAHTGRQSGKFVQRIFRCFSVNLDFNTHLPSLLVV